MDRKKLLKSILYPPKWLTAVLTVTNSVALIFIFIKGWDTSPFSYIVYIIAFYTLSVLCIFIATVLPKKQKEIKQKILSSPLGNKYFTDATFRTHISLCLSLTINLLYVGVNVLSFFLYRSMWFTVLAGYYAILAVMRFLLARYARKNGLGKDIIGELKSTVLCSSILLTVNFALSGAVLMMLYQNRGFNYHGILIYVMAAYTFYLTVHAIIDLIKYRQLGSPLITTSKVVALSAALVSMLSLETAMFSQFGQNMTAENKWLMIALTGAGVSIAVTTMSLYMIIKSVLEIKKMQGVIWDGNK